MLFALSKTPQNMEKESVSSRIVAALRGGDWNDLISLKNSAINAFPHISDDIPANREAKKALMLSCLDTYKCATDMYYFKEGFKNLPDNYYKGFKEQMIDKCLYSPEFHKVFIPRAGYEYVSGPADADRHLFNIGLVDTLDESIHCDYLRKNLGGITTEKQIIFQRIKENISSPLSKDDAYKDEFVFGFNPRSTKSKYRRIFIYSTIENCNFDITKVAEALNLSHKDYAEDIIKDLQAKTRIKQPSLNAQQRLEIYKERLKEKIANQYSIRDSAKGWCQDSEMVGEFIDSKEVIKYLQYLLENPPQLLNTEYDTISRLKEKVLELIEDTRIGSTSTSYTFQ